MSQANSLAVCATQRRDVAKLQQTVSSLLKKATSGCSMTSGLHAFFSNLLEHAGASTVDRRPPRAFGEGSVAGPELARPL